MKFSLALFSSLLASPSSAFAPQFNAARSSRLFLDLGKLFGTAAQSSQYPIYAEEAVMSQKAHGTSENPVQKELKWKCDFDTADRSTYRMRTDSCHCFISQFAFHAVCNFNRHYAEVRF